jgi:hypothetical protein
MNKYCTALSPERYHVPWYTAVFTGRSSRLPPMTREATSLITSNALGKIHRVATARSGRRCRCRPTNGRERGDVRQRPYTRWVLRHLFQSLAGRGTLLQWSGSFHPAAGAAPRSKNWEAERNGPEATTSVLRIKYLNRLPTVAGHDAYWILLTNYWLLLFLAMTSWIDRLFHRLTDHDKYDFHSPCAVCSRSQPIEHITPALQHLHWLVIMWSVQCQLCIMMHSIPNRSAHNISLHTTDSANHLVNRITRIFRALCDGLHTSAGPTAWYSTSILTQNHPHMVTAHYRKGTAQSLGFRTASLQSLGFRTR